jgi:hypothetical protein
MRCTFRVAVLMTLLARVVLTCPPSNALEMTIGDTPAASSPPGPAVVDPPHSNTQGGNTHPRAPSPHRSVS